MPSVPYEKLTRHRGRPGTGIAYTHLPRKGRKQIHILFLYDWCGNRSEEAHPHIKANNVTFHSHPSCVRTRHDNNDIVTTVATQWCTGYDTTGIWLSSLRFPSPIPTGPLAPLRPIRGRGARGGNFPSGIPPSPAARAQQVQWLPYHHTH